ncbi:MAG: lysine exporter LysO family protein [Holophagales bacterium]|nr:lysine exporter LysO family protein [Holophagales bacterium]
MSIFFLSAALISGALLGWALSITRYALRTKNAIVASNRHLTRVSLWALLGAMGAKLALHRALFVSDLSVFFVAIGSSVALTVVFVLVFWIVSPRRKSSAMKKTEKNTLADLPEVQCATNDQADNFFKELLPVAVNVGFILVGFILFWFLSDSHTDGIPIDTFTDWLLRALLCFIGFDLGVELRRLDLRLLNSGLLLVPFLNIALSLAVGLFFGLLSGLGIRRGALMTAGMGWYSLSSVLLAERGMMVLSILAFIHNVFRELLAILCAPLAARISPLLPVYLGGATSMDVMLPFVQRYSGSEYTLVSFYSGIICSIAVMPLVKIIIYSS